MCHFEENVLNLVNNLNYRYQLQPDCMCDCTVLGERAVTSVNQFYDRPLNPS